MTEKISAVTESRAAEILAAASGGDVDIATHVSPDADTLGCALALAALINENGGHARVVLTDTVPEYLKFLTDGAPTGMELRPGSFRLAVDVAAPRQLGALAGEKFDLMIDHHGTGEPFCDNVVDAGAAACGEIVFRIIKLLRDTFGMRVPVSAATYLYAAISGDTGSFRFANTTADTHRAAAELHEMGADTVTVAHRLHAVKTLRELRAERLALSNMKLLFDGKLVATSASSKELAENGILPVDFAEADLMRSVSGALVGVSLRESSEGEWRVSTRSNVTGGRSVDCAAVCARFGGGGHRGAAGCTVYANSAEAALAAVADAFSEEMF